MKIVKPSAILKKYTPDPELAIEEAGRTAYQSADKITADSAGAFIRKLDRLGHLSVFEHASATIKFVIDRGVSHELVRHRLASYTQESTRFCCYAKDKYGGEISVIEPPGLGVHNDEWKNACYRAELSYLGMIRNGIAPQIARSVLPTCLKTEIVVTANFREWLHIFKLRTSSAAHPQIREVMKIAQGLLAAIAPNVFKPGSGERE
jgi:thymidylate synthase (FAD)